MVRNLLFFLILISVSTKSSVAQTLRSPVRDPIRSFQRPVVSWTAIRDQNVVLQQKDFSCGAAALATVLRYYWG
ncbi:MAG: peptidase C39, partial [Planctomycetota bacterium]|nr:peptidase C39 [Planctomycetota bacterium]